MCIIPRQACVDIVVIIYPWMQIWSSLFSASACTYGSAPECVFPCNCEDASEICDPNSGECQSGCKDGPPAGQGFRWSGPGCRLGEWITFH